MINKDYSKNKLFDELGLLRLKDSYMMDGEQDPQDRFEFICNMFGSNPEHAQRLYNYASNHWLSYSTPILSFGRTKNGLPISCYLNYLEDSSEGLVNTLSETNWLSMLGGGVGIHIGIRGVDDKSTGVMPHLKLYEASSLAFRQGKTRRGSYAAYLDISHPDIVQFLEMRKPTGDPNLRTLNLNHGINIPDKFMQIIENCMNDPNYDDSWELIQPNNGRVVEIVSAKDLWQKILEIRANTGEPYLWFIDTANKAVPEFQKKLGLKNHGSNLCVAPETEILTDNGYKVISGLEGQVINVWNGTEFSEVIIQKTGTNAPVVTVTLDNGMSLDCTQYHKFYIKNSYSKPEVITAASDLRVGDKVAKALYPVIDGFDELYLAYQNGFFTGDGCEYNGDNIVYLYGQKRKLIDYFLPYASYHTVQEKQDREVLYIPNLKPKFLVPSCKYSISSRITWLAGLLDADGTIARAGDSQTIQLASVNLPFLKEVQKLLHTLGCSSTIKLARAAGIYKLPKNNGTNELGDYSCKEVYRILISGAAIMQLIDLGIKFNRLELTNHKPDRDATRFAKVVSIIDKGRTCDTYCFNEPIKHKGIFNGILTGNCSEISLVTSPERTAVCCLSSVNLEYYDDWKSNSQFIPDVLEMLDNVIEYFINHAPDAISKARYSAYRERSVGIGVLGFHAYLQKRRVSFESALAKSINLQIFKSIRSQLDLANENLAKSRLPCPDAAESGIIKRNSHVMAIAPTASASIIMGNTSPSIEPYAANVYRQDTVSGAYINKNRQFTEFLENYAIANELDSDWVSDQWESIIANKGSIQHLEWVDDYSKQVFKTAREIDPEWIISHACDRQEHIDQAQSVNIYIDPKIHVKRLHMLHFMAWKHGLKGLYYCRSEKVGSIDKMSSKIERIKIEDEIYSSPIQQQANNTSYWDNSNSSICLACE